jgi:hypothetical protein
MDRIDWDKKSIVKMGDLCWCADEDPDHQELRPQVEPWLAALLQGEHLSLLLGNGMTTGVACAGKQSAASMGIQEMDAPFKELVLKASEALAAKSDRGQANVEDQIRAARQMLDGLRILAVNDGLYICDKTVSDGENPGEEDPQVRISDVAASWETILEDVLTSVRASVLAAEKAICDVVQGHLEPESSKEVRRLLGSFLWTFASRAASRERLHIFTTNYDRLVEFGCDMMGIRVVDRFVGTLSPVFRSSRLGVDLHYNPPGIRSEPRYLEGVVRLTKLHGSVDWYYSGGPKEHPEVRRHPIPFGDATGVASGSQMPGRELLIYPNPAKDIETLEFPYADLFRDFAAALCQPNSVLVTYGYGFGDDHINRTIVDMLSIPSTHVVVLAYNDEGNRIRAFIERSGREEQISLLIGSSLAGLQQLVDNYLPTPAIDRNMWRMVDLLERRKRPEAERRPATPNLEVEDDVLLEPEATQPLVEDQE